MAADPVFRVLIIDDEMTVRRFLKATLIAAGYGVFECSSGEEGLESAVSAHPDAIILDLGLPDIDGEEIIRKIRKRSKTPIIVISVREDESDKIGALDAGADDYLVKPFDPGELLARLRAVMRRLLPANEENSFKVGKLFIDLSRHHIELAGRPLRLTPTEYDVLKVLAMNAGKIVTRKQMLKEVWNKDEDLQGVAHLLRVTISNLRDKIEPDPDRPSYVLTEPAIGYRLRID